MIAAVLSRLVEMTLLGSLCILATLVFRLVFRQHVSPRVIYGFWALPAVRLLFPFSFNIPNGGSTRNVTAPASQAIAAALTSGSAAAQAGDAAVTVVAEAQTAFSWAAVLLAIWLAGCLVTACLAIVSNRRLFRQLRETSTPLPRELLIAPAMELWTDRLPAVYLTQLSHISPCLVGVMHPRLYLTESAVADEAVLRHALLHELCHMKQRDNVFSFLRTVCCVIHWFNPLVWVAAHFARQDCELSCDSQVLRKLPEEAEAYGRSLLTILRSQQLHAPVMVSCTTMTGSVRSLRDRITMIARQHQTAFGWGLAAVLAVFLLSWTFLTTYAAPADNTMVYYGDGETLVELNPDTLAQRVVWSGGAVACDPYSGDQVAVVGNFICLRTTGGEVWLVNRTTLEPRLLCTGSFAVYSGRLYTLETDGTQVEAAVYSADGAEEARIPVPQESYSFDNIAGGQALSYAVDLSTCTVCDNFVYYLRTNEASSILCRTNLIYGGELVIATGVSRFFGDDTGLVVFGQDDGEYYKLSYLTMTEMEGFSLGNELRLTSSDGWYFYSLYTLDGLAVFRKGALSGSGTLLATGQGGQWSAKGWLDNLAVLKLWDGTPDHVTEIWFYDSEQAVRLR